MFFSHEDAVLKDKVTPYRCTLLVLIKEYALLYDGKNKNYPRMVWQDGEIVLLIVIVAYYVLVRSLQEVTRRDFCFKLIWNPPVLTIVS